MAAISTITGERRFDLNRWRMISTPPGAVTSPDALASMGGWREACTPCTVASVRGTSPDPDSEDHWFCTRLESSFEGQLVFEGLATLCEVWIGGEKCGESRSMFLPLALDVSAETGSEIALCFRALGPALEKAPRRARWRPAMIHPHGLRWFRTSLLGSMPGWCPSIRPVGPYRPVTAAPRGDAAITRADIVSCDVRCSLDGADGIVELHLVLDADKTVSGEVRLTCGEASHAIEVENAHDIRLRLRAPGVQPWFPHTHGEPALYNLGLTLGGAVLDLGRTGFRNVLVDKGADGRGFGLVINGVPVFARGASWSNADLTRLPGDRTSYEPWLLKARDAGMNMIRISGVMTYETRAFFDLCDELGIMIWQDMMLANFDYPQNDAAFSEAVRAEAEHLLNVSQTSPALTVLCGGSEVFQQSAMLGAPPDMWSGAVFDDILPDAVARLRPDILYVPNSPSGGALPFVADEGVTHYYGTGAYMRDLDDARRANVRFASECLAFANVPEDVSLDAGKVPHLAHHPDWKAGVARDRGASWDFDDVRDHYLEQLYGVSAMHLRRGDNERYLALSRAVTAEVMEHVFAEWRRPASQTRGGLVWLFQDLAPGAGWGVIASDGEPKSSWYGLKRAFRPVQLTMTDEGVNGLAVHLINEAPVAVQGKLSLTCWRDGSVPVVQATRDVTLDGRSAHTLSSFDLIGRFFDITNAYRFGPPQHDVTSAALTDTATGKVLAEAFHFPLGRSNTSHHLGLAASVARDGDAWMLDLSTQRFAQSVHIVDEHWRADDNWFHLSPGTARRLVLKARKANAPPPSGEVRAVNGTDRAGFNG